MVESVVLYLAMWAKYLRYRNLTFGGFAMSVIRNVFAFAVQSVRELKVCVCVCVCIYIRCNTYSAHTYSHKPHIHTHSHTFTHIHTHSHVHTHAGQTRLIRGPIPGSGASNVGCANVKFCAALGIVGETR